MKRILSILFLLVTALLPMYAQSVYELNINDDINSKSWIYTQKAFDEAETLDASLIIVHINTYGGEVLYADSIRTKILNSKRDVVAFIDNNAASAGALISIACDRIYMRKGASIGAATVVNGANGQAMPDKYQSYMRATMRATAEAQGKDSLGNWIRDPLIAEAMVDDRIVIPNLIDSGKTLTFTAEEALKYNYCNAVVEDIHQIVELEGYPADVSITTFKPTGWDNIKGWLTGTALRSILIMLIIGGIYFELQSPGIGFALLVSIVSAVLYFAPLYIDGLAAYWEIIIFAVGIILMLVEIFVIPGFGIAGISGIICMILGLTFSLIGNDFFDFRNVHAPEIGSAAFTVFLGLILGFIAIIWLSSRIGSKGLFYRLALQKEQCNDEGYIGVPVEITVASGDCGTAVTDLRPSGKVEINGKRYDAVSAHGFIEKGSAVIVRRYETGQIYVDKTE